MKHLKKFNETIDYSGVVPHSEYDKENYLDYAEGTVGEVRTLVGRVVPGLAEVEPQHKKGSKAAKPINIRAVRRATRDAGRGFVSHLHCDDAPKELS